MNSIYNDMPKEQLLSNEEVIKLYTDAGVASCDLYDYLLELQKKREKILDTEWSNNFINRMFEKKSYNEKMLDDDPFHGVPIDSEILDDLSLEDDLSFEFDYDISENSFDDSEDDFFHGVPIDMEIIEELPFNSYENLPLTYDDLTYEELTELYFSESLSDDSEYLNIPSSEDLELLDERTKEKERLEEEIEIVKKKIADPANLKREYKVYPSKELEHKVFNAYLYLVHKIAKKYSKSSDLSYDDAFQIGSLGLLSACHYYVPGGSATFKTYAYRCIENSLKKSLMKNPNKKKKYTLFDEIERIEYFEKYLESFIYFDKKRKTFDVRDDYYRVIRNNFGLYTKSHNRKMYLTGNNHLIFNKTTGKDYDLSAFLRKILSSSSLKYFITDDDKEAFKVLLDYEGIAYDKRKIFTFYELVGKYVRQLKMCKEYIQIYDELQAKNDGAIPDDDKIFKIMNDRIREKKKQIPFYKDLTSFYHVYLDKFNVDMLLKDEDSNYPNSGDMSRHQEIEDLEGCCDRYLANIEKHLATIKRNLNGIEEYYEANLDDIKSSELSAKFVNIRDNYIECAYSDTMVSDSDSELLDNGELLLLNFSIAKVDGDFDYETAKSVYEDYIKKLTEYIDFLKNNKDVMVGRVLKRRADEVNSIINKDNAPKIEINKKIYEVASRLGKVLRKHDFKDCTKALDIMYADELFLDTMPKKSGYSPELSLEDEAIDNLFMKDYAEACLELTDEQKLILSYWFDSTGRHSYSAQEISKELGIKKSDVIKEKNKALKKLSKNQLMIKHLND